MNTTALVFYGHCRSFFDHIRSIQTNIIDVCNCDVLISTCDKIDGGFSQYVVNDERISQKGLIEKFSSVKNLVKYQIVPEEKYFEAKDITQFFQKDTYFKAPAHYLSRTLYGRKLSSTLLVEHEIERGCQYDAVISMCMDCCVLSKIDNDRLHTKNTFFTSLSERITKSGLAIGTRINFGDRQIMKFWLDMYDAIDLYGSQHNSKRVIMESLSAIAIKKNSISYDDIAMTWDLIRLSGIRYRYDHIKQSEYYVNDYKCTCRSL